MNMRSSTCIWKYCPQTRYAYGHDLPLPAFACEIFDSSYLRVVAWSMSRYVLILSFQRGAKNKSFCLKQLYYR